jgi:hypothetical protein
MRARWHRDEAGLADRQSAQARRDISAYNAPENSTPFKIVSDTPRVGKASVGLTSHEHGITDQQQNREECQQKDGIATGTKFWHDLEESHGIKKCREANDKSVMTKPNEEIWHDRKTFKSKVVNCVIVTDCPLG